MKKLIIAVDFDQTLHTAEWPEIGPPKPYAVHALKTLKEEGHYLILWSCREGRELLEAVNWMCRHGIPFDRINDNHPEMTRRYGGNSRKVYADLYLDDKQLGGLPDWGQILDQIRNMNHENL